MITVELRGGLGNQLFQYAAGIALSEFHGVKLNVDITQLKEPDEILGTYRRYCLSNLLKEPQLSSSETPKYLSIPIIKKIDKILPTQLKSIFYEKHFHYNPLFWKTKKTVYLRGNFQSYKYFQDYKEQVLKLLVFKQKINEESVNSFNNISNTNSLAIHIRRGDYVSNKIASDVLGTLNIDYYKSALEHINSKTQVENIYVFSDDLKWAKENLSFITTPNYIDATGKDKDIIEFNLMKSCKHQIIANSSFSWWAAYLNPNPNKIIIAPQKWFNKVNYNTKDLFPQDWVTI